jgi:hypothetical protein
MCGSCGVVYTREMTMKIKIDFGASFIPNEASTALCKKSYGT